MSSGLPHAGRRGEPVVRVLYQLVFRSCLSDRRCSKGGSFSDLLFNSAIDSTRL